MCEFSWKMCVCMKDVWKPPLPTTFLNFDAHFLQTLLQDPFAYCLAALVTSYLTGAKVFGRRKIFPGEFLAKKLKTQIFSEDECYFVALV